jgi:hypothetical protein
MKNRCQAFTDGVLHLTHTDYWRCVLPAGHKEAHQFQRGPAELAKGQSELKFRGYDLAGCADRAGVLVYRAGTTEGIATSRHMMMAPDWDRFAIEVLAILQPAESQGRADLLRQLLIDAMHIITLHVSRQDQRGWANTLAKIRSVLEWPAKDAEQPLTQEGESKP